MPNTDLISGARARRAEFLDLLERFVRVESPTRDEAACDRMADLLEATLTADGWAVARDPRDAVGDVLCASLEGDGDGRGTLVLAHYDTVWPIGTLATMPFRVDADADRAYGPGTLDMKGGIVATLLAGRLLTADGRRPRGRATLLITSDEETGSAHSRARIEAEARAHDRVLVVEAARDDGALKVGRKGVGDYHFAFHGISAHAGNYPDDGASALVELAHAALFVRSLDDPEAATTAHPTVARAGSTTNVIAEHGLLDVDVRVLRLDEAERVDAALRAWEPRDARVRVEVTGGLNRPPMEPTPANLALFERARALAAEWGGTLEGAVVGGGSDGNFTSALGVPTLDGIGGCGQGAHARGEHVRIDDTLERAALLAALLADA
ncbi:MAG: M20 family metallopeptidase [Trueperaceae bacterium]